MRTKGLQKVNIFFKQFANSFQKSNATIEFICTQARQNAIYISLNVLCVMQETNNTKAQIMTHYAHLWQLHLRKQLAVYKRRWNAEQMPALV
jgi:hypothetical protein